MVNADKFREIALSFQGTEENPHFDRTAFKVKGKRIFASLLEKENSANIKFSPVHQSVFCQFNKKVVYPVPNKFGLQGWTTFDLNNVPEELISDALLTAYNEVIESKPNKKK